MIRQRRLPICFNIVRTLLIFVAVVACSRGAPSQDYAEKASLYGTIRDPQSKPIGSATVHLKFDGDATPRAAETDAEGKYRFPSLRQGVYSLEAEIQGFGKTRVASIFLGPTESKVLDLTLEPAPSGSNAVGAPAFFDPPQFTVSGVTDTSNLGGHGSDTMVRARDTIAKEAVSLGEPGTASAPSDSDETFLRERVKSEPQSFATNYALGDALVHHGKEREAIPYLQQAAELDPRNNDNAFDLALAYCRSGDYARALQISAGLATDRDTASVHHLLAEIQERSGNSLEAVREYQRASELDPSEPNLFDWGSELLLHHAPEPAAQVFTTGSRLFPQSIRMLVGLGVAEFADGSYDLAVERFCAASDSKPEDPVPYIFLGKIQGAGNNSSEQLVEHLHRFMTLHPDNAEANYFYAVALWKKRKDPAEHGIRPQVESLLNRAIRIDPKLGAAQLQLGILHAEEQELPQAISDLQRAVEASPELEEAHYRLAQAYRETGQTAKAKAELQLYQRLTAESAEKNERERHEIRQFVYTLRDQSQR